MICYVFEAKMKIVKIFYELLIVKRLYKSRFCDKYLSHPFKNVTGQNARGTGLLGHFVTKNKNFIYSVIGIKII